MPDTGGATVNNINNITALRMGSLGPWSVGRALLDLRSLS